MAIIRPTGYLAHYGFSEEDVLEHYGVKGMKWGKRKALKADLQRYDKKISDITNDINYERNKVRAAANERATGMTIKPVKRTAPNTGYEYISGEEVVLKDAYDKQKDAARLQGETNRLNALRAKRASVNSKWQKTKKEYDDSRVDKVIARGAKSATEKGKKKINDLLKAADAGWNKSRARDTAIAAANKASDVVESIHNKDGSISFKKKKKS